MPQTYMLFSNLQIITPQSSTTLRLIHPCIETRFGFPTDERNGDATNAWTSSSGRPPGPRAPRPRCSAAAWRLRRITRPLPPLARRLLRRTAPPPSSSRWEARTAPLSPWCRRRPCTWGPTPRTRRTRRSTSTTSRTWRSGSPARRLRWRWWTLRGRTRPPVNPCSSPCMTEIEGLRGCVSCFVRECGSGEGMTMSQPKRKYDF